MQFQAIVLTACLVALACAWPFHKSQADNKFCHSCEIVINEVKGDFKNNFTGVDPAVVKQDVLHECDMNFAGWPDTQCRNTVTDNWDTIYAGLVAGQSAYGICQSVGECT